MLLTEDITSVSDFRTHTKRHLTRLKKTGRPEVLTTNGRAEGVVLSPAAYERMANLASLAESIQTIRRSVAELEAGKGRPALDFIDELARQHGVKLSK